MEGASRGALRERPTVGCERGAKALRLLQSAEWRIVSERDTVQRKAVHVNTRCIRLLVSAGLLAAAALVGSNRQGYAIRGSLRVVVSKNL